jgi:hypothetical protein
VDVDVVVDRDGDGDDQRGLELLARIVAMLTKLCR